MTEEQRRLVQMSFAKLVPKSEYAATLFYKRFFELAPEVEQLFKSDLNTQGIKLFQVISFAVLSLDNLDELLPVIQDLGRRHVQYGAMDSHYIHVGNALLWTIEEVLKEDYTPDVKAAWTDLYKLLASAMRTAATPVD